MFINGVYIPPNCTEREPGGYEDCTWCTGVVINNAAHGRVVVPNTRREYEALRVAGGDGPAEKPGDGSNYYQLCMGMERRYDWQPKRLGFPGTRAVTDSEVLDILDPGIVAGVQGGFRLFSRSHRLRRWDTNFLGGHSGTMIRVDGQQRVWWLDPLAPNSYAGEWMSFAEVRAYVRGFAGGIVWTESGRFALPDTGTEDIVDVFAVVGDFSAVWPAGTVIYRGPEGSDSTGKTSATRRYALMGQDKPASPTRYLVDGTRFGDTSGIMRWLPAKGMTSKRDESYNAGVTAAVKAAAGVKRST